MLALGLGTSHSPSMFVTADKWEEIYQFLVRDTPHTKQADLETPEDIDSHLARIDAAYTCLEKKVLDAQLDLLIMIGGDQDEVFDSACIPSLAVFTGSELGGSYSIELVGESLCDNHISLGTDPDVASALARHLLQTGFDVAVCRTLAARARPHGKLGHAFTRPAHRMRLDEHGIPVLPIFLNNTVPPLPTARRCYDLGRAIRTFADRTHARIGVLASGGLSHDPLGPRSGWIDSPLDNWFLDRIRAGDAAALTPLFSFESDTLAGGTGEIRSWIAVASAMEPTPAVIVDYIAAHRACTGLAFAYWEADGA